MLKESAFGKNDIRGIYGDDITEELFYYTGRGFVQFLVKHAKKIPSEIWISVCRDARLHSPSLSKSLISLLVKGDILRFKILWKSTIAAYFFKPQLVFP